MLAVALQSTSRTFEALDERIETRFLGIDDFEFQQSQDLRVMRDDRLFTQGGYKTFEQYCEQRFSRWGGYRRVNQLIGAAMVAETLKDTEFDGAIKRESHARPLLRLVKQPEKLKQAVAIAYEQTPTPIAATFKKAVEAIAPREQKPKLQEQLFPEGTKVRIAAQHHPDFDQEGVVIAQLSQDLYTIELEDGRRAKAYKGEIKDAVIPVGYTPKQRTYTEEELQEAIARAIQEQQIGKLSELREKAEAAVAEELKAAKAIASQKSLEIAKLQQRVDELESLRTLEAENEILKREIEHLKELVKEQPQLQWQTTATKQAQKVMDAQAVKVIEAIDPEVDLRQLAIAPPPRNRYSEIIELYEKAGDMLDRVPLIGRRVSYQGRLGTIEDIEDDDASEINWDDRRAEDSGGVRYSLNELTVLPTIEGIAEGSIVSWDAPNNGAYSAQGKVLEVSTRTSQVKVKWTNTNKVKFYPVALLRLVRAKVAV